MSSDGDHTPAFFDWQGIHIYQNDSVHKVGTDAVLLGAWVSNINLNPKLILDAGTGTGILAMMMANCFPTSKIHAIDIDVDAIQLAMKNVNASQLEKRITLSCEDIVSVHTQGEYVFDLILSNPPYYTEHIKPVQEFRRRTKHLHVHEREWINSLVQRLSPEGHLCVVVPFDASLKWIHAANEKGYYNQHRLNVYSFETDLYPKKSLLHFASALKKPVIEKLSIYKMENHYTKAYLDLTGIRAKA